MDTDGGEEDTEAAGTADKNPAPSFRWEIQWHKAVTVIVRNADKWIKYCRNNLHF